MVKHTGGALEGYAAIAVYIIGGLLAIWILYKAFLKPCPVMKPKKETFDGGGCGCNKKSSSY
jgi:cytosine/uracil/thiamine/allantoin permease